MYWEDPNLFDHDGDEALREFKVHMANPPKYLFIEHYLQGMYSAEPSIVNPEIVPDPLDCSLVLKIWTSPVAQTVKHPPVTARDADSVPGSGRSPGGGHISPFQYSCPENLMNRGAWWATVHGVAKSWTRPSDLSQHKILQFCFLEPSSPTHIFQIHFLGLILVRILQRSRTHRKCICCHCLVAQSCSAFCHLMDCCLPDSVHGVSQARILEWVAISVSRGGVYKEKKMERNWGTWLWRLLGSLTD